LKPGLTREKVLTEAIALADADGLMALSMRKLAARLGVEAMSLYNHIKNKDDLHSGVVDLGLKTIPLPRPGRDWRGEMRARAAAMRHVFLQHPWLPMMVVSRPDPGPHGLALVEATLATLAEAGFSLVAADHAWNAMDSMIYGFVLLELNFPFEPEAYADVAAEHAQMLVQGGYPTLAALAGQVAERKYDGMHDFSQQFDTVLNGLAP